MTLARRTAAVSTVVVLATGIAGCDLSTDAAPAFDDVRATLDVAWAEAADPGSDMAQMELLVADCMAEAGFDYVPVDYGEHVTPHYPASATSLPATPSARTGSDDVAGSGYGITSAPPPDPTETWTDPNAAHVAEMSPEDQQAYWTALDGQRSDTAEDGEWQYDWRTAGCRGLAQNRVYGDPATLDQLAVIETELDQARLAAASDPRMTQLDVVWADCMARAGYPDLATVSGAETAVRDAWDALWDEAFAGLPPEPSDADVTAAAATAQDDVAALARREAATATADLTCRDTVGYEATRAAISTEYQDRFYQAHRAELEAWAATFDVGP
jgi:hypothetical protein